MQTASTNLNNKPDIIIHNNEKRTFVLIDVAISGDRNVIKKVVIKINFIIHQIPLMVIN